MSHTLATLRELEAIYPIVVDRVLDTVPAERAVLFRVASSGELVSRVARNRSQPGIPVEVSRTLIERVLRERVGLLLEDALLDSGLDPSASIIGQQIRALLCVPILFDDDLLGALYLDAPGRGGIFSAEDLHFVTGVAGIAAVGIANAVAVEQVRSSSEALNRAYLSMLAVLANAIEARDAYTIGHTWRVARVAQVMARRLGWPEERVREIEVGGVLHDIGKIGVPDAILGKQGRLTPEEAETMRRHPEIGARMLGDVPNLRHALPYVLHHHECYDGSGYPHGLAGEDIPEEARLLAVADGFDAMTSTRPYRAGMDPEKALAEIRRCSGSQFDPAVVAALDDAWAAGEIQPFLQ
jgi:putative nucleotidyltransferase with HDIG domain